MAGIYIMGVFISWRGADRDIKNTLVNRLSEALGPDEKIWESDTGCTSDFSSDCIEAIGKCSVFVVIVSDAAMQPSYVLNEIIEARRLEMSGKLNIVMFKITDSPLTPAFAANLNHVSDANHVGRMRGDDSGIESLIQRVKLLLARRKNNAPELPYEVFSPEIEGLPLGRMGYFVEGSRTEIFAAIDRAFETSGVIFASQMSGYGRKSAVHKYAELHLSEYDTIKELSFFSGSIKNFITDGLIITNINDNVFEQLTPEKLILKKFELLKKLDERTLLIIPNVVISPEDDYDLCVALASLRCRIIFIVQSVPAQISGILPCVNIGRIDNTYLRDLFFHYFTVPEEDKTGLSEALDCFFDRIDGHTKSVELTALSLSREIGVYAEDIPRLLESIANGADDELSERIHSLILGLFDTASFTEVEKKILYVASVSAWLPMDEKDFVELLKACDCFDSTAVRGLQEKRWLDIDEQAHTISIDEFLGHVCTEKLADKLNLKKCISFFFTRLERMIIRFELQGISYSYSLRLSSLLRLINVPSLAEFMTGTIAATGIQYTKRDEFAAVTSAIEDELSKLEDSELYELCSDIYHIIRTASSRLIFASDPAAGDMAYKMSMPKELTDTVDYLIDALNDSALDTVFPPALLNLLECCVKNEPTKLISSYLALTEEDFASLAAWREELSFSLNGGSSEFADDDDSDEIYVAVGDARETASMLFNSESNLVSMLMTMLGLNIIDGLTSIPDLCARACKILILWSKYDSGSNYIYSDYKVHSVYSNALLQLGGAPEEIYACRNRVLESAEFMMKGAKASSNADMIWYNYASAVTGYMNAAICLNDSDKLREILPLVSKVRLINESIVELCVNALRADLEFLLPALPSDDWCCVYRSLDLSALHHFYDSHKKDSAFAYIDDFFNEFKEAEELLTAGERSGGAQEPVEYLNYYQKYSGNIIERNRYKGYCAIADETISLDYSKKSNDELRAEAEIFRPLLAERRRRSTAIAHLLALVSEAGLRTLGYRLHYVQIIGAAAIIDGKIAEMQNGEGKTYTIAAAAYVMSLEKEQVHILDSSVYLTRRNFHWMYEMYRLMGCSVCLCDEKYKGHNFNESIIYSAPGSIMFATMFRAASNAAVRNETTAGGLKFDAVIVDEADQLLIAEGTALFSAVSAKKQSKTFLPIEMLSGLTEKLSRMDSKVLLDPSSGNGTIVLSDAVYKCFEELAGASWDEIPLTLSRKLYEAALEYVRVNCYYEINKDYFIQNDGVYWENKASGTFLPYVGYADYFLRIKENLPVSYAGTAKKIITNQYCVLEFIKKYKYICGASATASGMAREFKDIYGLEVVSIPTEKPIIRNDIPPVIYMQTEEKYARILHEVKRRVLTGQPVLIVTGSVIESEKLSAFLNANGVTHVLLNAKNIDTEATTLSNAGKLGAVTITTALANRGVDIKLGGNPEELAKNRLLEHGVTLEEYDRMYESVGHDGSAGVRLEYLKALAFYRMTTESSRREIIDLGGLCVIGTECFEELRTEQQMRGRAGRQGTPGTTMVFYSLRDSIFTKILPPGYVDKMVSFIGNAEGPLASGISFLNKAIERSREKLQRQTFEALKEHKSLILFAPVRKVIFDLYDSIREGQIPITELVHAFYAASGAETRRNERLIAAEHTKWLDSLRKGLSNQNPALSETKNSIVRNAVLDFLEDTWTECLTDLDEKYKQVQEMTNMSPNSRKRLLEDYREQLVQGKLLRVLQLLMKFSDSI